mgnify:FL=1
MYDYASTLDASREYALSEPALQYRYAENFMLSAYDAVADIGLWLHLGTCPDDFGLWEDQVLISLPNNDGLLWMSSYHRTPAERRPAGGSLRFECIKPFKQWRVTFDGVAVHSSNQEMMSGRVRDGVKRVLKFQFDIVCAAPVWDTHETAMAARGRGSMQDQSWANQHYQQLFCCSGNIDIAGARTEFDGRGVRDHSRGQRGHAMDQYGGHNLFTAVFPSGRAFGLMSMWAPSGEVSLSVAYVVDQEGRLHHADIISPPIKITDVSHREEQFEICLRSELGEHVIGGQIIRSIFATALDDWGMAFGAEAGSQRLILAPSFAHWTWAGEESYGLAERSNRFG